MTKFQALFVYWLREKCNCSWRALDAHFNNRYNEDGSNKKIEDKINFDIYNKVLFSVQEVLLIVQLYIQE